MTGREPRSAGSSFAARVPAETCPQNPDRAAIGRAVRAAEVSMAAERPTGSPPPPRLGLQQQFATLREAAHALHSGSEAIMQALRQLETCDALRRMRELSARAARP